MNPQATAGRMVHYYPETGGEKLDGPYAAIVSMDTNEEGVADLTVCFSSWVHSRQGVPYSEEPKPGHWSWMPYQKAKAEAPGGNQSESAEPRPPENVTLDPPRPPQ